jgi:hypothetical protein
MEEKYVDDVRFMDEFDSDRVTRLFILHPDRKAADFMKNFITSPWGLMTLRDTNKIHPI